MAMEALYFLKDKTCYGLIVEDQTSLENANAGAHQGELSFPIRILRGNAFPYVAIFSSAQGVPQGLE